MAERMAALEKQKEITNEKILDNLNDLQNQKIVLDAEERVYCFYLMVVGENVDGADGQRVRTNEAEDRIAQIIE
jgi:hypothetical protein